MVIIISVYIVFLLFIISKIRINKLEIDNISGVSIVIPCRNEEKNISDCLNSIIAQNYPKELYEVIVVDDGSDDATAAITEKFLDRLPLKIIVSHGSGKKQALTSGINSARFPLIQTLDADCTVGTQWLRTMVSHFNHQALKFLCGPVSLTSKGGVFESLQKAESAAVVGISATMLNDGKPSTCNGANLLFDKSKFQDIGGYSSHSHLASGDDDLLMQRFFISYPEQTAYILHQEALVYTPAESSIKQFLQQRLRWISKRKAYIFPYNSWIQILITLHLLFFYIALFYVFSDDAGIVISVLLLKYTVDLVYAYRLHPVMPLNPLLIFLMPFYQIYVFVLLFVQFFKKPTWKGRRL